MTALRCLKMNASCDDCDFSEVECGLSSSVCIALIGFKNNNLSTPVIRFADCFPKKDCKNVSVCEAQYEKDHPFTKSHFCCCDKPFCNKNYTLVPVQSIDTSNSAYEFSAIREKQFSGTG